MNTAEQINAKFGNTINMEKSRVIFLEGSCGMFCNIPHPTITEVRGHACIPLREFLKQVCAMKVLIEFTKQPESNRNTTHIHGSDAMTIYSKY